VVVTGGEVAGRGGSTAAGGFGLGATAGRRREVGERGRGSKRPSWKHSEAVGEVVRRNSWPNWTGGADLKLAGLNGECGDRRERGRTPEGREKGSGDPLWTTAKLLGRPDEEGRG
jgi:hypothetical protein